MCVEYKYKMLIVVHRLYPGRARCGAARPRCCARTSAASRPPLSSRRLLVRLLITYFNAPLTVYYIYILKDFLCVSTWAHLSMNVKLYSYFSPESSRNKYYFVYIPRYLFHKWHTRLKFILSCEDVDGLSY